MSNSNNDNIEKFKEQILTLKSIYNQIKIDKTELLKEKFKLIEQIEIHKVLIQELEEKVKNVQIANAVSSSLEGSTGAKKKIDGLVREIDKCIALLNN